MSHTHNPTRCPRDIMYKLGLCNNNDKSIIVIINTIAITKITICIIAIITMCIINTTIYSSVFTMLFLIKFFCGLEVARKPYLMQTLRLALRQAPTYLLVSSYLIKGLTCGILLLDFKLSIETNLLMLITLSILSCLSR